MSLFGIKKRLKALMRRLKIRYTPSIIHNCPYTASKVVDNTISTANIFKKQYTHNKTSQLLIADSETP